MQHRQTTTERWKDDTIGGGPYPRTLPGLSGGRMGWLSLDRGCIRPPSPCKPAGPLRSPFAPAARPPTRVLPPRSVRLRPRTYIRAREHHDGPFTIDTIVAASWPSPLRRRSLVSSTDSICPPRGCLITGRRVDRGRARQKGRARRAAGTREGESRATKRRKTSSGWSRHTGKEGRRGNGEEAGQSESTRTLRAHTTDNPIYWCIGAAGSAATKTLTE